MYSSASLIFFSQSAMAIPVCDLDVDPGPAAEDDGPAAEDPEEDGQGPGPAAEDPEDADDIKDDGPAAEDPEDATDDDREDDGPAAEDPEHVAGPGTAETEVTAIFFVIFFLGVRMGFLLGLGILKGNCFEGHTADILVTTFFPSSSMDRMYLKRKENNK